MNFYDYLRSQFSTLDEAKNWYRKWRDEWEQDIPDHPEWSGNNGFSMRAMAAHISCVLADVEPPEYHGLTHCMSTKYGPEILMV